MNKHMKAKEWRGVMCEEGSLDLETTGLVKMLTLGVDRELYWCPACLTALSDLKRYTAHIRHYHSTKGMEGKLYPLPLKDAIAMKKLVYEAGSELTYYQCLKCFQVCESLYPMAAHLRVTQDNAFTCLTLASDGFEAHRQIVKALSSQPGLSSLCNTCGKHFSDYSCLWFHQSTVHKALGKQHLCHICNASFTHVRYLRKHIKTHSPNRKKYLCDTCGSSYLSIGGLEDHLDRIHRSRRFACQVCGKAFLSRRMLYQHNLSHSRGADFTCSQCSRTFVTQYCLKVHQRIHTGEKPYGCEVCEAAFAQKNSLNVHMRKHGIEIQKPRRNLQQEGGSPCTMLAETQVSLDGM
ncbi:gastrula zinc finger protein XlCGF46.1-like [Littorina saxatilis]|uniref:gastrula zinc finger protein XlCGF46.1-like n=1 Tax=Littorina saxatilis TaxID=31220 RepID=UPI0038B43E50